MGVCQSNFINQSPIEGHKLKSFSNVERYKNKIPATCKILSGSKGTGFFCKINIKNKSMIVLMTNNHVINNQSITNNPKIEIEHNNNIKYIEINNKRFFCTNEQLDYTCIEIFSNENINDYFEIDEKINVENPFEEYKYDLCVIIQYPFLKEPKYDDGKIKQINQEFLYYSIATEEGSSGSPIFLSTRNLKIIGIHSACSPKLKLNKGTLIKYILDDIQKQYSEKIEIKFNQNQRNFQINKREIKGEIQNTNEIKLNQNQRNYLTYKRKILLNVNNKFQIR